MSAAKRFEMIEYHDLPAHGDKRDCWLAVYRTCTEYHYSINGFYIVEIVH